MKFCYFFFCLFCFMCPPVQNPVEWLLVWGVWWIPRWLSHRNGEQAGWAADSTFARRGEPVGTWVHLVPELVFRWLPHPHHTPAALPAWPYPVYHRGWTLTQVRAHLTLFTMTVVTLHDHYRPPLEFYTVSTKRLEEYRTGTDTLYRFMNKLAELVN